MISKSYLDDISDTKVRNRIWTILRLHEVKIQIGLYFMYTKYKVEIEFGQYLGYKSSKSNFGRYFVYMWLNSNLNYILGTWGQNRILTIFRNQVFEIEFGRYFDYMRSKSILDDIWWSALSVQTQDACHLMEKPLALFTLLN